jgi:CRP/FNR family transcriptional regulator, cyclic AMP receptor protein
MNWTWGVSMSPIDDAIDPQSFTAALSRTALATIESLGHVRAYHPGSVLFHQGEPTGHVAVLLQGWVKVVASARNGEEAFLAIRGPGDVLGELSAVDGRPRSATVSALVPVRVRVIQDGRFLEAVTASPELCLALLRHLTAHLRDSDRRRLEYVSTSTFQRLVALLVELADTYGDRRPDGTIVIRLPLTQWDLAAAAAMSREAIARGLRTLRERDLVRTDRRRIALTRPHLMRSLAASVPDESPGDR